MNNKNDATPAVFFRDFPRERFILKKEDNGLLVITRPTVSDRCLQIDYIEARQHLTDVLTPTELHRLDSGCIVEIWGDQIRVVAFEKLWGKQQNPAAAGDSNQTKALT